MLFQYNNKVDCVVPPCSEMECVPSFHEEFNSIFHNCDIDDEVEQIPCFKVEPRYIPRNVGRQEERKKSKVYKLLLRN